MFAKSLVLRLLGVALLLLVTISSAAAHARYVRSEPAEGATLASAPQQVTIWFSQLLDPAGSSITAVDSAGTTVSQGAANVLANDQKAMQVALRPNLGPGRYTVQWTSLSAEDGEADSGSFSFTISGERATAPTTGDSDTDAPTTHLPATGVAPAETALLGLASLTLVIGYLLRRWLWGAAQVPISTISGRDR